ncbi:translin-associated protein X isoform 2-T2 [Leptodactylus fuscus]|uniref:translin-associated protein X isoform X2 n=1 Tax=Leptodactylus fuscus TaxID=238119 RepID=UPI003F4E9242
MKMNKKGPVELKCSAPDFQQSPRNNSNNADSSPVIKTFKSFQGELDARHDKHERLVKIGRDITIESKRTIFLLHRVISAPNKDEVLKEAKKKLDDIRGKIKHLAKELINEDMYQYHRAFTFGIQEYVEAVTFQHFIVKRTLIKLSDINSELIFKAGDHSHNIDLTDEDQLYPEDFSFQITPVDYLLGVADLTGELMRLCISSVGNGDIDTPFQLTQFLREIFDGFAYIGNSGPYEISRKLFTLKQSLSKVENACYMLKVRGSETPKHMLADLFVSNCEMFDHGEGLA